MSLCEACPLCQSTQAVDYHRDTQRQYWQCPVCDLVFVPDMFLLAPAQEKQQYDLHRNAIDDAHYRQFLSRLSTPLMQHCAAPAKGLDFGCGPGPALAQMLEEQGYRMSVYDPFYFTDKRVLSQQYDFITCTEVIEHVYDAHSVWQQLFAMLEPAGWLGIMTKRVRNQAAFAQWHYKHDPTHVRFYSEKTLAWVATRFGATLLLAAADVALFRKIP
ncbi:MAG TPA: class I SAM-dependent methyltransferase [Pseudomonadales bacterium]|nr:class I SAM-dependent methyltransferase [Pseudomonadales bacterium]